jgi:molecular chaperone GrpE (heat shock protein)
VDIQEYTEAWRKIGRQLEYWSEKFIEDMLPVAQSLNPYLSKQKILDRRKLASRRARRGTERKMRKADL